MSDTPRTDAAVFKILSSLQSGTQDVVDAEVARQLEIELAQESIIRAALQVTLCERERKLAEMTADRDAMVERYNEAAAGLRHET